MERKKTSKKGNRDTESSMAATNMIIFSVSVLLVAGTSVYALKQDVWVQGETSWLISRASAMAAFTVLTVMILLGLVISHPRNKDTWRLTPKLLPWHQALLVALFALLGLHIFFTVTDPKSGVSLSQLWYPIHAQYYPVAMLFGAFALYALLAVTLSVGLRRLFKWWLPMHRLSWLTWVLVFLHGLYGGSDTKALLPMYVSSLTVLFIAFFWRHWTDPRRRFRRSTHEVSYNQKLNKSEGV